MDTFVTFLDANVYRPQNANACQLEGHTGSLRIRQRWRCGRTSGFLCKQSGKVYWHSELSDDMDELPDDVGDSEKYVQIPDKRELDLGKPLVLDFARQFLPDDFDEVLQIFSRRGAYAKFKDLLARRGALDQWYDFEANAEERALRMWCDLNSIEVND